MSRTANAVMTAQPKKNIVYTLENKEINKAANIKT
jgi:hypothetical protein